MTDRVSLSGEYWVQTQARIHRRKDSNTCSLVVSIIAADMLHLKDDTVISLWLPQQQEEKQAIEVSA